MNLEHKSGKRLFVGAYLALFGLNLLGLGSDLYKTVQQFLYTESVECRSEKHRCDHSVSIVFD